MSSSKGVKDCTDEFLVEDAAAGAPKAAAQETDAHRIAQRQKQVDLGKNTLGYQRYRQQVSRTQRVRNKHPVTPDVHQVCSKRSFDGQIKKWRRQLHEWDPHPEEASGAAANPPAPASERSYEMVSHEEATEAAAAQQSGAAGPKNGGSQRPADAGRPQRANPTALGKRNFSESAMTCQSPGGAAPGAAAAAGAGAAPSSKQAKHATLSPVMAVVQHSGKSAAAAAAPAARADGEVDYGEDEEWAYIEVPEAAAGTVTYNNWLACEDSVGDGLDDIVV